MSQEFTSYVGTVHSSISGSSGDYLATSISLNFESDRVALSTSNVSNYTGRVEIHDYTAGYWVKNFTLSGPDGTNSSFGHEISLNWSGTRLAVSAYQKNKVYIYDATGSGSNKWSSYVSNTLNTSSLSLSSGDEFGYSISLAQDDGNRIAVGAPGENKVYVYEYDNANSNWGSGPVWSIGDTGMKNLVAKTVDTDGLATAYLHAHNVSNRFGHKVRLSAFGNYLIVGAPGTIATINSSSAYDPHTSTTAYSGTAYTNQRQIGNVRCFTNDTSTWASGTTQYGQSILGKAGTAVGDNNQPAFGTSCDISTNGNKISVSSPYKKVSTLGDAGQIDTYLINDDLDTWLSVSTSIAGSKSSQKLGMNLRLDFAGERLATGDLSTSNQESAYYGGISLYALDFGTDRWYDITPPIQVHNWPTVGSIDFNPLDITNGKIIAISDPRDPPGNSQSTAGNSGKVVFYQFPLTNAFQGNMSIGGYLKCENLYVGANDNSSNTDHSILNKRISFGGTIKDNSYEETYIENRSVDGAGKSELLLYKRNDIWDKAGGNPHSTNSANMVDDSIRIKAAEICLDYEDTNLHGTYPNAATRNTRFLVNRGGQIAVGNAFYDGNFDVVSDFDVNDRSFFWTTVNIGNKTNKPLNAAPTLNTNNERMFAGLNAQTATPIGIDGKYGTQQFERYNTGSQAWDSDEFAFYFSQSNATIYENTHPGNWHGSNGQFSCWIKLNDTQSNCAGVLAWFGEDHHRENPANTYSANWSQYRGGWLKLTSTGLQYEFEHNSANVQSISYTFNQDAWYHIAGNFPSENTYPGAYSGQSWPKIFIDGVEETLSSYPGSAYNGGVEWDFAQYGFGSAFTYSRNNNPPSDNINYSSEIATITGSKNNGVKNCWIALMDIGNGTRNVNLSKIMPGEMLTVGGICTITKYLGVGVPLPKYQIDVNGDINFTGNLRKSGVIQTLGGGGSGSSVESDPSYFYVIVENSKFGIDGTQQPTLTLYRGVTYRFDQSSSTNGSHPFRISTTAEGGDAPGTTYNGSNGSSGSYRQYIVPDNAPNTVYYNCSNHSGMGGTINIISGIINTSGLVASNVFMQNNVGIGTNSPSRYLDIAGSVSASSGGILIRNGDSNPASANAPQITFGWNGNDQYKHFIRTRHNSASNDNSIDFYVCNGTKNNSLTSGVTHNLTLESGKVGIGTGSPEAQLHVKREGSSGESNVYIQSYSDYSGDQAALFLGTPHHNDSASQPKCAIIADAVGYSRANLHFCLEGTASNGSSYRASTSNSRMMINGINGLVGIGTTNPTQAKLVVLGSAGTLYSSSYGYLNSSGFTGTASGSNYYGIYASSRIASGEFNVFSDSRIKKNVVDINDSSALDKIRNLKPKIYNYIDEKQKGTSNVYGFIAQEVANVLPYAVTVGEGDIPNILTNSNVSVTSDSNVLELRLDTTVEGLTLSNTSNINITIDNDQYLTVPVLSFSGSNVITIQNSDKFTNVTGAYIHGEHIQDFNNLNKDAIWAVSAAALQEVDRQLQAEKTKVVTLETQVADLLARVTALENN